MAAKNLLLNASSHKLRSRAMLTLLDADQALLAPYDQHTRRLNEVSSCVWTPLLGWLNWDALIAVNIKTRRVYVKWLLSLHSSVGSKLFKWYSFHESMYPSHYLRERKLNHTFNIRISLMAIFLINGSSSDSTNFLMATRAPVSLFRHLNTTPYEPSPIFAIFSYLSIVRARSPRLAVKIKL